MKAIKNSVIFMVLLMVSACAGRQGTITIQEDGDLFAATQAPLSVPVSLSPEQLAAAREGRLALSYQSGDTSSVIPVQLDETDSAHPHIVLIMPALDHDGYAFNIVEGSDPLQGVMQASADGSTGQILFQEQGKKILQYNYHNVNHADVIRPPGAEKREPAISKLGGVYLSEFLKENPQLPKDSLFTNLVYAVPRSDYVHPLYGLDGEMLTKDWPADGEFHHRGIFWAWPEVEVGSERGDLYALQRIFSRPTGNIKTVSGPVFAQVTAENLWKWGDSTPVVREQVDIRAYRQAGSARIIDFAIELTALKDSVTLATRLTNSYGGFCVRMQTPREQNIAFYTDTTGRPVRAWSDLSGMFQSNPSKSGLMILQNKDNPEYPGAWAHYENLSWVQPTFPTPDTRYPLKKGDPLILRYRLIIHKGGEPDKSLAQKRWDVYHNTLTPLYQFSGLQ